MRDHEPVTGSLGRQTNVGLRTDELPGVAS